MLNPRLLLTMGFVSTYSSHVIVASQTEKGESPSLWPCEEFASLNANEKTVGLDTLHPYIPPKLEFNL